LSKLTSSSKDGKPKHIQWETLTKQSVNPREVFWLDMISAWMDPIRAYLADRTLPSDHKEADLVKKWANLFMLYDGILYK